MNKNKIGAIFVALIFMTSMSAQIGQVSAQDNFIEQNFEIYYYTQAGSRLTESYALYVKQALAPLGIDVKIFAKPWGQFVGDLLHYTTGQPFDMAHVRYGGGSPTPDFWWQLDSVNAYGVDVLQLDNEDWQAHQLEETGYTQAEIDEMIWEHDDELDGAKRLALFTEFNQLFFDKLLYELPIVAPAYRTAIWKGFGGADSEGYDTYEGLIGSAKLGAEWNTDDIPEGRKTDATYGIETFQLSNGGIGNYNFDPDQSFDSEQTDLSAYSYDTLLTTDGYSKIHPSIAWNFVQETGLNKSDEIGNVVGVGNFTTAAKYTYFLRPDAMWSATVDSEGNDVPTEAVDANDVALLFDQVISWLEYKELDSQWEYNLASVLDYEVSTTLTTDDTFTFWYSSRTPDDDIIFGGLYPLPDHLLGGDLTYYNKTSEVNTTGTIEELADLGINARDTFEWDSWESQEGHTHVGMYALDELVEDELLSYVIRDDYYFPNENDVETYHSSNPGAFTAFETASGKDVSLFGGSTAYPQTAHYFAYDAVKPTASTFGIKKLALPYISDTNSLLLKFEAGELDVFGSTSLGAAKVEAHENDDRFSVKVSIPNRGPELLFFNLLNQHLQKLNVRKAINFALDRDQFVNIHDGFAKPWYSLSYPRAVYGDIQATGQGYDYEQARDLMRLEGYSAADSNDFLDQANVPDAGAVADALGVPGFGFWIALFGVFVAVPIARRRKD